VGDELIAGIADLISVALAGEVESALDGGAVDRRRRHRGSTAVGRGRPVFARRRVELLDHGEEVGEELAAI
jgi:hypothetical protein